MILIRKIAYCQSIYNQSKLVFFGSGRVALPSLRILHQNYSNLQVVTQSSQHQTKIVNQVEIYCREMNLIWSSPITNRSDKEIRKKEWMKYLDSLTEVDFGIVCSYGYMLPSRVIKRFKHGMIVIHPSLLPKYRGGAPIFHAIANGQTTTGVSYIEISQKKYDQGSILHQIECPINPKATYKEVQIQLAQEAAKSLPFVIENIDSLRPGVSQSELQHNVPEHLLSAPLFLSDKLDVSKPAQAVYNWSRALETPRVRFNAKGKDIILKFLPDYIQGQGEVGSFQVEGNRLYLRCQDKFIRVRTWYQPGRMEQPPGIFIAEFIRSGKYPSESVRVQ